MPISPVTWARLGILAVIGIEGAGVAPHSQSTGRDLRSGRWELPPPLDHGTRFLEQPEPLEGVPEPDLPRKPSGYEQSCARAGAAADPAGSR